jgi:hypothetical protein
VFAQTQRSQVDVTWFGGFNDAEFTAWKAHQQNNNCLLPVTNTRGAKDDLAADMEVVKDITGAVPMYLNAFSAVWANTDNGADRMQHAVNRYSSTLAQDVEQQMEQFLADVKARSRFFSAADCFLRNDTLSIGGEAVDHRFFYKQFESGRGAAVCGVARDLLSFFVRQHQKQAQLFLTEPWVSSCRDAVNVVVQGFIAEQIVISTVSKSGISLRVGDSDQLYAPSQDLFFTAAAAAAVTKAVTCVHYIPKPYNYKYVDSVIRSIDAGQNRCTIIALQPTLQSISRHKRSLKFFASQAFKPWERDISDYTIDWHFVWIVGRAEEQQHGGKYPKISEATQCAPAFTEHCLSFQQVAPSLEFL